MRGVATVLLGSILVCRSALLSAEPVVKPLRDRDVVARVNGAVIYRKSVRDVVQGILSMQDQPPNADNIAHLADEALDSLIALELLYQAAQAQGVTVADSLIDEEINRTKSHFPDESTFDSTLKAKGMTMASLRQDTRKTLMVNRFLEGGIWRDVTVPPERLKRFYEENKEQFKHPPQIRASHILVRVPDSATAAERVTAKQHALKLLDQLKAGADFAELARVESDDEGTKPLGGDLGYFAKGDMDEAFEKEAFALEPGQLSGAVTTQYGYHIIKLTGRRPAGYDAFDEVQDRIRAVLIKEEKQKRQTKLVDELRKKATVVMGDEGP